MVAPSGRTRSKSLPFEWSMDSGIMQHQQRKSLWSQHPGRCPTLLKDRPSVFCKFLSPHQRRLRQFTYDCSCGSSAGASPAYIEAARSLAYTFHQRNIHLVYGGGTTGIMGALAHTLVSLSGPSVV